MFTHIYKYIYIYVLNTILILFTLPDMFEGLPIFTTVSRKVVVTAESLAGPVTCQCEVFNWRLLGETSHTNVMNEY